MRGRIRERMEERGRRERMEEGREKREVGGGESESEKKKDGRGKIK